MSALSALLYFLLMLPPSRQVTNFFRHWWRTSSRYNTLLCRAVAISAPACPPRICSLPPSLLVPACLSIFVCRSACQRLSASFLVQIHAPIFSAAAEPSQRIVHAPFPISFCLFPYFSLLCCTCSQNVPIAGIGRTRTQTNAHIQQGAAVPAGGVFALRPEGSGQASRTWGRWMKWQVCAAVC